MLKLQEDRTVAKADARPLVSINGTAWNQHPRFLEYAAWLTGKLAPQDNGEEQNERFEHSLGVCEAAIELAQGFGLCTNDIEKAMIAGILHDAAKLMTPALLLAYAEDYGLALEAADLASPQTLHPFIGAEMVKSELGITDEAILNTIRYHTTGRSGMSPLEKIVYVADKSERRTRNPHYVASMTQDLDFTRPKSLDETALRMIDTTLSGLIEKRLPIHPRTLEARNDLILSLKDVSETF
ncbi:MAG: bis(5'-nucleosyl)-tetraphosphatase (symmetrical) YqeK [Vampirovibrionales bacterium]|nr:bis(5'-nucleosyl)-tetraphosphatase (symmetrical) YqeK [Vampirovibrionales bacterium]